LDDGSYGKHKKIATEIIKNNAYYCESISFVRGIHPELRDLGANGLRRE
jgi:hypothetical protein